MPPSKASKTSSVQPLLVLEWSLSTFLVVFLWCSHLTLNILGLTALWSDTFIEIVTNNPKVEELLAPSLDENHRTELYESTYKDNVKQFWDADAGAVAAIIVFSGLVQPAIKCVVLGIVAFRPMSLEMRERLLELQEATSKFTTAPFYVEALLLMAFTYTYTVERLDLRAKIYMEIYVGLLLFFVAQLNSFLLINVIRVLQRNKIAQITLARLRLKQHNHNGPAPTLAVPATAASGPKPFAGGSHGGEFGADEVKDPAMLPPASSSSSSSVVTARRPFHFGDQSNSAAGPLTESLLQTVDHGSASQTRPSVIRRQQETGVAEGTVFGRDAVGRQKRRDLRRAAVVVPASAACVGCFFYIYTHPIIEFKTSGLLVGVTDEPTFRLGFGDVADGVLEKTHPLPYALFFSFWFYVNLVVVPTAVPLLAVLDCVLALLPHYFGAPQAQREHRRLLHQQHRNDNGGGGGGSGYARIEGKPSLVLGSSDGFDPQQQQQRRGRGRRRGRGGGSCLSSTVCNRAWATEFRKVLQDNVQLMAVWGTGEAAVVAVFFLAPNIGNVAHWVFDGTDPCPAVEDKTGGTGECVAVQATVLATGGCLLVAWIALYLFLVRVLLRGRKSLAQLLLLAPLPNHHSHSHHPAGAGGYKNLSESEGSLRDSSTSIPGSGGGASIVGGGAGGLDDGSDSSESLLGEYKDDYDENEEFGGLFDDAQGEEGFGDDHDDEDDDNDNDKSEA